MFNNLVKLLFWCLLPVPCFAEHSRVVTLHLTHTTLGLFCVVLFVVAYIFVTTEEFTHLSKSKPIVMAAGLIWCCVALLGHQTHHLQSVLTAIDYNLIEYIDLFLFLTITIIYVNALEEQHIFVWIRKQLTTYQCSYRTLFWLTGGLAFLLSTILNNLTTALLLYAVIMAIGHDNPKFLSVSAINIVVSSNAGGVIDPFGDITTLMVWQHGILNFFDFFALFIPALISYLIPAFFMMFAIPKGIPAPMSASVSLKPGSMIVILLFILTLITAVFFRQTLGLLPSIGMTTGLGYLWAYDYWRSTHGKRKYELDYATLNAGRKLFSEQWDTLLFFYGVMLSVGGLATLGYLQYLSHLIYPTHHAAGLMNATTVANTLIGFVSAVIDNIPVMFAILTMDPNMSNGQWLLVTLTSGIGGSLLAVGSAAGVALLGQSKGGYTFIKHLLWLPIILLGYLAAIACHLLMNAKLFG